MDLCLYMGIWDKFTSTFQYFSFTHRNIISVGVSFRNSRSIKMSTLFADSNIKYQRWYKLKTSHIDSCFCHIWITCWLSSPSALLVCIFFILKWAKKPFLDSIDCINRKRTNEYTEKRNKGHWITSSRVFMLFVIISQRATIIQSQGGGRGKDWAAC